MSSETKTQVTFNKTNSSTWEIICGETCVGTLWSYKTTARTDCNGKRLSGGIVNYFVQLSGGDEVTFNVADYTSARSALAAAKRYAKETLSAPAPAPAEAQSVFTLAETPAETPLYFFSKRSYYRTAIYLRGKEVGSILTRGASEICGYEVDLETVSAMFTVEEYGSAICARAAAKRYAKETLSAPAPAPLNPKTLETQDMSQVTFMRDAAGNNTIYIYLNGKAAGEITFNATTATVNLQDGETTTFKGNSRSAVKAAKTYVNRALRASRKAPAAPQLANLFN